LTLPQPIVEYSEIPANQEAGIKRMEVRAIPGKKFVKPHLNEKTLDVVVCVCNLSEGRKLKIGELQFRLAWAKSETLSPK
jgi:hypothetical protein